MDTIRQRLGLFLQSDAFSHRSVGKEHEFLHQFVGILGSLEIDADGLSLLINLKTGFLAVEVDGAFLETLVAQQVRHAVERDELVGILALAVVGRHRCDRHFLRVNRSEPVAEGIEFRVRQHFLCRDGLRGLHLPLPNQFALTCLTVLLQQILHFLVSVTSATLDDRMLDTMAEHLGILVHLEDGGESEFLFVGAE